jgi:hypothetical protein
VTDFDSIHYRLDCAHLDGMADIVLDDEAHRPVPERQHSFDLTCVLRRLSRTACGLLSCVRGSLIGASWHSTFRRR